MNVSECSICAPTHGINQDAVLCLPPTFFAIADGVGGGELGEVASETLVRFCADARPHDISDLTLVLHKADRAIQNTIALAGKGPGAAVLGALWRRPSWSSKWFALSVGDCRILHVRRVGGQWNILWQSVDQTYANLGIQPPPGIADQSPANMVGNGINMPPQLHTLQVRANDRLILCSDGLHASLRIQQMLQMLNASSSLIYPSLAEDLCKQAVQLGSLDDVSLVIIEILPNCWPRVGLALLAAGLLFLSLMSLVH